MEDIFNRLKRLFKNGNILAKLIFINAGVFILIRLSDVFITLFNIPSLSALPQLQLPSSIELFLHRPWTIITYMFTHFDFWHIGFNMLLLYGFGRIFLLFLNLRQMCGVYLLGGIAGGMLYILAYNLVPYFSEDAPAKLMGASASVMAIVFAVSFYRKEYEIHLVLLGRLKLIYIALAVFLVDLLSITSSNAGGHIAHIGGALLGIGFACRLLGRGKDMTAPLNRLLDRIINLGKRKPKSKSTFRRAETKYDFNARRNAEIAEMDSILDKVKQSGYSSLSAEEKKKLFDSSKKL
ncbi:MAG: rhomboid family intramembrane serine protease [Tannerellaceae bacterium]|nr:rhomboid family intramembrane serine protease [Tannerellaceae bacterium]